jgi:hypothetical protein
MHRRKISKLLVPKVILQLDYCARITLMLLEAQQRIK